MFKATLEIGGFINATDCGRFVRAAGSAFVLREVRGQDYIGVGSKLIAGGNVIGAVVMLRKGVTLRIDTLAPGAVRYVPALVERAAEWAGR